METLGTRLGWRSGEGSRFPPKRPCRGPFLKKSRNFMGHFWVSQFPLYLKSEDNLSRQTSQWFFFLLPLKRVKRSAFQNKRLAVSQRTFRAGKVTEVSRKGPLARFPDLASHVGEVCLFILFYFIFISLHWSFTLLHILTKRLYTYTLSNYNVHSNVLQASHINTGVCYFHLGSFTYITHYNYYWLISHVNKLLIYVTTNRSTLAQLKIAQADWYTLVWQG